MTGRIRVFLRYEIARAHARILLFASTSCVSTRVTVCTLSLTHSRRLLSSILSSPPPYLFPNNDRDRAYYRERRRGIHRRYVSIYRKGERGGECKANELGLDDRARCTRSVRSGRSFMHSGFFADNKIAASVWRVVWAVYSARHSPLNEQLNTHLYDAFAVTVNKKGEGGRGRSVSIILISSEVNSFKFIVFIFDD